MEKVMVEIEYVGSNYCAHAPILLGCVSTGDTLENMKKNIAEAIMFHVEGSLEDNEPIPDVFKGAYELEFKLSTEALLNAYSKIFTKDALSRITGINERQLWHYAAGVKKPRQKQALRIEKGLHQLGQQLLSVHL
jgi:predicted RNase H-like HicB family nuclease